MLEPIATDIWSHDSEIKVPIGAMHCRATILRMPNMALVIHSPVAIDDATAKELETLGEVRFIIAPSTTHWMFLKAAKLRYPTARVFGPPGLEKKLGKFDFERLPTVGNIEGLSGLRVARIQGVPFMMEHAFFHEASRSLLVTDLLFNVHHSNSFGMRLLYHLFGTWKKTAQSRVWRLLVRDHLATARSVSDILAWPFERVVVAHGTVIEDDARERAREALAWMTSPLPKQLGSGSTAA